jgi:dihydroxy-acid dehydratase
MAAGPASPSRILTPAAFRKRDAGAAGHRRLDQWHRAPDGHRGRVGLEVDLDELDRMGRETPVLLDLKPSASTTWKIFTHAGGMATLLRELRPLLQLDA